MKTFILSLCLLVCGTNAVKLPQTFPRCKVSAELDNKPNECLRKAVEESIAQLADKDNPELGTLDLDPLKINKILIEQGETSPIAIKLEYTDNVLNGLKDMKIKSVKGKLSSPENFEFVMEGLNEELSLIGPYSVNGKVLILPIQGVGKSVMKFFKLRTITTIKGEAQTKNGKEYLKITSFKLEMLEMDRLIINLSNLFNGDKALGDNMNKFLNENGKEIFTELRPSIEEAFSAIFEVYSKRILERIQYKNIFLLE